MGGIAGCPTSIRDEVKVRIAFTDGNRTHRVTNVSVIVGSDKFWWPEIHAGQSVTVNLEPDPKSEREVVLLYTLNRENRFWDGPKLGMGSTSHQLEMDVDAGGTVVYRSCVLPCELD